MTSSIASIASSSSSSQIQALVHDVAEAVLADVLRELVPGVCADMVSAGSTGDAAVGCCDVMLCDVMM